MSEAPSVRSRESWLGAAVLVLGAVFFAALGIGVASAPMHMHPALGWLLKGFIGMLFGSLAGGALLGAVRAVRPAGRPPAALLARCLGCGEPSAADAPCPVCAMPPMDRARAITVAPAGVIDAALLTLGAASMLCLGVFVAVGPWIDGERRVWVLCAMGALAVLLLLVGAAGVAGGALDLVGRWRRGAALVTRWSAHDRWISGDGHARRGRVAHFTGCSERREPLAPSHPHPQGYRALHDDTLAEALAIFQAAGLLTLEAVHTWRWSWGEDGAATRTDVREAWAGLADVTRWREGGCYEAAANALYRVIEDGVTLWGLRDDLREKPDVRAQWDGHAAALREAGVVSAPGSVEAVAAALRAPRPAD
jgi:hypothetical protein